MNPSVAIPFVLALMSLLVALIVIIRLLMQARRSTALLWEFSNLSWRLVGDGERFMGRVASAFPHLDRAMLKRVADDRSLAAQVGPAMNLLLHPERELTRVQEWVGQVKKAEKDWVALMADPGVDRIRRGKRSKGRMEPR